MATLKVGQSSGFQYSTIGAAVRAASAGDEVDVQAGTYTNDFVSVYVPIKLVSVGGVVAMVSNVAAPNGKGIIDAYADLSVNGFSFTGAQDADYNGAGIRQNVGNAAWGWNCVPMGSLDRRPHGERCRRCQARDR